MCVCVHTSYLKVRVEVSVCEQRLGQLSQESLEQCGHVVRVEVSRLQVDVGPAVEEILQGLLPHTVPRHPEQTLHVQIWPPRQSRWASVSINFRHDQNRFRLFICVH